jgi:hypothetical protein
MKFNSQIVTAASGSIGGCTYSRNRSGMYIRGRTLPVNPNSAFQQTMRAALTTLVARWTSVLTTAQRDAWSVWAFNTPQTDKLGNPILITGQNAYIKMNAQRLQIPVAVVDDAPTVYAGAVLTPPVLVTCSEAAQLLEYSYTATDQWNTEVGGHLLVYGGRPQNPSKLFFAGPYRFAGADNGAVVPPASPSSQGTPFPFVAGQRIHVRFVAMNADGRISGRTQSTIIAVA